MTALDERGNDGPHGTLDLRERARTAIGALSGAIAPDYAFAVWQSLKVDAVPPTLSEPTLMQYKYLEALVNLRQICGDAVNPAVDDAMMESVLARIGPDGLIYAPPKSVGTFESPAETASHTANGRTILTMAARHRLDGNPIWLERMGAITRGLDKMAIRRRAGSQTEYAFYPSEAGWSPHGRWIGSDRDSWLWTSSSVGTDCFDFFPYTAPDEAAREQQGREGAVKGDQGNVVRGIMEYHRLTADESALNLAQRITRYCLLPSLWDEGHQWGVYGHEAGIWAGHFHGQALVFRAMLDVAMATGDQELKDLVRAAYEHGCRVGVRRLGWFPAWVAPERYGRPHELQSISETCAIHDMIALAISMSDAGLGDYWDDVDQFARNQLVEQQFVDRSQLDKIVSDKRHTVTGTQEAPLPCDRSENVLDRIIGSFGEGTPSVMGPVTGVAAGGCCTGNGALSIYHVWEAVTRHNAGLTTINLFMDRSSPWVDVKSLLPYEGRVQISVKVKSNLAVRVPGWLDIRCLAVTTDGVPQTPGYAGRYMTLQNALPGQVVELNFPVRESNATYHVRGRSYSCSFMGSTAVEVVDESADSSEGHYRLYQRSK